jgi:hypothetical protein
MANINVSTTSGNTVQVKVTPLPDQIVQINRGVQGPQGPAGTANIGGYPSVITSPQNYDALMFLNNSWVNIPQTEISDGGNF